MRCTVTAESWPLHTPFVIARGTKTHAEVIVVRLDYEGVTGWGEAVPYARYGESSAKVCAQIQDTAAALKTPDNRALQHLLPAGSARNALDAACWDWRAKALGKPVWELAAVTPPKIVCETAFTLSIDTPTKMAKKIVNYPKRKIFKVKLQGDRVDPDRIAALVQARPEASLILDANEGVPSADYQEYIAALTPYAAHILCLEQPVAAADDACLFGLSTPFIICADESCHTASDVPSLVKKYGMINIKMDKAGGLTEAIALLQAAQAANLSIMLGCMVGPSLAMAPAFMLNAAATVIDLDGPLLLRDDRPQGFLYHEDGSMHLPSPFLWGVKDSSADS